MEITKHEFYDHQFTPWKDGKRTHERNWNAVRRWNDQPIPVGLEHSETCDDDLCGLAGGPDDCAGVVVTRRPRVFCASLADWLEPEVPVEWLADLLALIHETPNLDWLLLTKRPGLFLERVEEARALGGEFLYFDWLTRWTEGDAPSNVWIGTTTEDQKRADERIPELLKIPARVRFLSCEPLLGMVDFRFIEPLMKSFNSLPYGWHNWLRQRLHWVIAGGESGPNARPMHPDWARGLRDQCDIAGVPFFFKQWGEYLDAGDAVRRAEQGTPRRENERILNLAGGHGFHGESAIVVARVGKHRAGRLLDGREHSAFPEVRP